VSSKKTNNGHDPAHERSSGFSRRTFIQGVSIGTGAVGSAVLAPPAKAEVKKAGPGKTPMTLKINGKTHKVELEPRVSLLDALRDHLDYTGAKKVCDRATCGACTVIVDGNPVYGCTMLAIEAEGRDVQTIEGFTAPDKMHPVSAQFVEHDAQQCGFCTPGFVVAAKAFLDKHPEPSMAEVEKGLCGNICRCGTYVGVREAVLAAAQQMKGGSRGD